MTDQTEAHVETQYDDQCGWCEHPIKVYVKSWMKCKSHISIPILANYCDPKKCAVEGCEHKCSEIAQSTPENCEKVLHEIWRRRRKSARLSAEEAKHKNRDRSRDK
jgi:hypothetical protein